MKRLLAAVFVSFAVLSSCVVEPFLVPDVGAQPVTGDESTAYAEQQGVHFYADGAAWKGDPPQLAQVMTPVLITIDNRSSRSLRLSYSDLRLVGSSGFVYPAMAPMPGRNIVSSIDGQKCMVVLADYSAAAPVRPPRHPRFRQHRFYVAPHYRYFYPNYYAWPNTFFYDPSYYDNLTWPQRLPTADMLAEALPEGVVQAGGNVQGFIYFQQVAQRERQVRLEFSLVNADDGTAFGVVMVPFVVRNRY